MITSPGAQVPAWPVVKPSHGQYEYVRPQQPATDNIPYQFYIDDTSGKHAYRLECHHDYDDEDYEIRFSGDYQCVLFVFIKDTVSAVNLLAVDKPAEQGNDWHNRGRVLAAQFRGDCLNYPEYSTARHFRLRGMVLTLGFSDIAWDPANVHKLDKFKMTVDVIPDTSAREEFAAPADGPAPPAACYPGPSA